MWLRSTAFEEKKHTHCKSNGISIISNRIVFSLLFTFGMCRRETNNLKCERKRIGKNETYMHGMGKEYWQKKQQCSIIWLDWIESELLNGVASRRLHYTRECVNYWNYKQNRNVVAILCMLLERVRVCLVLFSSDGILLYEYVYNFISMLSLSSSLYSHIMAIMWQNTCNTQAVSFCGRVA